MASIVSLFLLSFLYFVIEARKNPISLTLPPGQFCTFLLSADFFQNQLFFKNSLRNKISMCQGITEW